MPTLSNLLGSRGGSMLPDVNLNVKAFDRLSIVKRIYDQIQTRAQDLKNKGLHRYERQWVDAVGAKLPITEGMKEITEFMSAISAKNGLAKPNWFKVYITQPSSTNNITRELSLFCESAQIPGHNVVTAPIRTYGVPVEMPYMRAYDPATFQFLVDTNMEIKGFFDQWMNLIVNDTDGGSRDVGFMSDYATQIDIYQMAPDSAGVVYWTQLRDAYPKIISPLELSHATSGQFHRLPVQFVYARMFNYQYNIERPELNKPLPNEVMGYEINSKSKQRPPEIKNPFNQAILSAAKTANQVRDKFVGVYNDVTTQAKSFIPSSITNVFS